MDKTKGKYPSGQQPKRQDSNQTNKPTNQEQSDPNIKKPIQDNPGDQNTG